MRFLQDYDRHAAVQYAHRWAYGRNPAYYDFEKSAATAQTLPANVFLPAAAS